MLKQKTDDLKNVPAIGEGEEDARFICMIVSGEQVKSNNKKTPRYPGFLKNGVASHTMSFNSKSEKSKSDKSEEIPERKKERKKKGERKQALLEVH